MAAQSQVWQIQALLERIASLLPQNEVPYGIRLVNRNTGALLRSPIYTTIHLSKPCLSTFFARHWTNPEAVRSLSLHNRRQLLCLTAATGSLANLSVAILVAGCSLTGAEMEAAAGAGHADICSRLRQFDCPYGDALAAAARAGRQSMCEMLLDLDCPWSSAAVHAAATGGHWELAAVEGFSLHDLQRRRRNLMAFLQPPDPELRASRRDGLLAAAARCCRPGWQAKLEWLETLISAAHPPPDPTSQAAAGAAAAAPPPPSPLELRLACQRRAQHRNPCTGSQGRQQHIGSVQDDSREYDMMHKVLWLRHRGYPPCVYLWPLQSAGGGLAKIGSPAGLTLLLEASGGDPRVVYGVAAAAAENGGLEVLQALHAAGNLDDVVPATDLAKLAARAGHVHVLTWVCEELGCSRRAAYGLYPAAAECGGVAVLEWVWERTGGIVCNDVTALCEGAVRGGCVAALEWVASHHGFRPQSVASQYHAACSSGDLLTLQWLHRRLPYRPTHQDFLACIHAGSPLLTLRWLAEEVDCPVEWEEAARAAERFRSGSEGIPVRKWLANKVAAAAAVEAAAAAAAAAVAAAKAAAAERRQRIVAAARGVAAAAGAGLLRLGMGLGACLLAWLGRICSAAWSRVCSAGAAVVGYRAGRVAICGVGLIYAPHLTLGFLAFWCAAQVTARCRRWLGLPTEFYIPAGGVAPPRRLLSQRRPGRADAATSAAATSVRPYGEARFSQPPQRRQAAAARAGRGRG